MRKFAIPVENGQLCIHFGRCQQFAIVQVDDHYAIQENFVTPPPHEPGLLPQWLGQQGVTNIIAAGIGQKAIRLFDGQNIQVTVGIQINPPKKLVEEWLANSLAVGVNACDH